MQAGGHRFDPGTLHYEVSAGGPFQKTGILEQLELASDATKFDTGFLATRAEAEERNS